MRKLLLPLLLAAAGASAQQDAPVTTFPYTPGLDVNAMDRTADPCVDFYQFTCGGWVKNNPIPADQAKWSVYGKLTQDNQRYLWGILDELAKKTDGRDANQQKIGDFFASCMDEARIEKLGNTPVQTYLNLIRDMSTKKDLPRVLAKLHLLTGEGGFYFSFGSNQDFADSEQVIAFASSGGLGLPDRDYYLKDDEKSKGIREKYVAHVAKMLEMIGDKPADAKRNADTVMKIETALAGASLTRVERRDPYKIFHKMDLAGLQALTPGFDWTVYMRTTGLPKVGAVNVTQPKFYEELERQWNSNTLASIKTYLRWHTVSAAAPLLSSKFVDANFEFYSKTLRGVEKLRPRWKRCVTQVDGQLGEALGREFVNRAFSPDLKEKTLRMTKQIETAMDKDIDGLDWMSAPTKVRAKEKLHTIVNKIGYPDTWRDYGLVQVKRADYFGNVERATLFETKRQLAKIGKPLDRKEWAMTPPTVNAYFDPQMNDINFPAGVLQPPLFDPKMDDAPGYGNTGGTIGHELTHGFDDEGRKFDAKGNLKDWWGQADEKAFEDRAQCIRDQYSTYTIVDDIKINGALTSGEDIADLGGLILAWMAWKEQTANQRLTPIEGMTPEQRFFVGYAQWACENERPENARVKAITDPHSPGKYRVNGLVVNMQQFQEAFSCKAGQPMAPEKRCRVW
ncbi:Neutral endopeptidase [Usitatibacter rugosus]|uniref:Neutral endopeptidase n=1 Tax=Usitatibacter rugosus TaxID=2732067 RepID=A0A6M4H3S0_9PROT|nr:M13 family metallopeptidase [Usitatibacter rugosus]QJR13164.1 Neutral endopeptidase [Usitatibacter rugosus]